MFLLKVWESCSDSVITFQSDEDKNLAFLVENDLVQASLDQRIKDFKNVEVLYSSQLKEILKQNGNEANVLQLKLKNDTLINTKLLIGTFNGDFYEIKQLIFPSFTGSDGPNSFVRKQADCSVTQFDYDQFAIVATMKITPVMI